jgi:hypothetical protein
VRVCLSVFLIFYTVNDVFFHPTLLHQFVVSPQTITIFAVGMSCILFDLGLGLTNF